MKRNLNQLICPVSSERTDEYLTRVCALFAIILMLTGLMLNSVLLLLTLLADFYLRAFGYSKYSPVLFASAGIVNLMQLEKKPIDKAPKIFAARMGFLMSLVTLLLVTFGLYSAAGVVGVILIVFATLELVFGFCAGCYIYTYFVLP